MKVPAPRAGNAAVTRLRYSMVIVVASGVLLWLTGVSTTMDPLASLATLHQYNDSWHPMMKAVDYFRTPSPGQALLYTQLVFQHKIGFLYPPTSLILPYALSHVVADPARVLRAFTYFFLPGLVFFLVLIFRKTQSKDEWMSVAGGLGLLTLFFFPVTWAAELGQIQTWINTAFAAVIYFYLQGRPAPAGIVTGLICAIKPHYALILVWGIARRQWRFTGFACATLLVCLAVSVALFGLANHLNYWPVISDISRHGTPFYANQSVNGLLERLFLNGDANIGALLEYQRAAYHPAVYYGTMAAGVLLTAAALWIPHRSERKGGAIDLSVMAITATIISPFAWDHYYGVLLPVYLLVFPLFWKVRGNPYFFPLVVSYALCSNNFEALDHLGNVPGWNLLVSYRLLGGILLWAVLLGLLFDSGNKLLEKPSCI
jgi:alpha-1,2-mannosyltransferase